MAIYKDLRGGRNCTLRTYTGEIHFHPRDMRRKIVNDDDEVWVGSRHAFARRERFDSPYSPRAFGGSRRLAHYDQLEMTAMKLVESGEAEDIFEALEILKRRHPGAFAPQRETFSADFSREMEDPIAAVGRRVAEYKKEHPEATEDEAITVISKSSAEGQALINKYARM